MDIRAELKNMMEEKGLTIVFVATAIGVAKSTISMRNYRKSKKTAKRSKLC